MLRKEVSKRILEQLLDLDTFETSLWGFGAGEWVLHTKSYHSSNTQNNFDLIWGYIY